MKFIGQLASATGDLSHMTCPAFLLNGYSLLEYSQHWADHPDLLWDLTAASLTEEERTRRVLAWFVSTLYGSYRSRCKDSSERKPFNPVLGETFSASWLDEGARGWGRASLIVEQVSHHPPVSAFCVQLPASTDKDKETEGPKANAKGGPRVTVQGHCGQRTTFNTTAIVVKQVGRVKINIVSQDGQEHEYTIFPLPELTVAGLLTMSIYVDLVGKSRIVCNSGTAVAELEYVPVGWFSGEHFTVKGQIKSSPTARVPYCTVSGKWTEETLYTLTADASTHRLFDVATQTSAPRQVAAIEKQGPTESLKLWGPVVEHLQKGDYARASLLKTEIEEDQRERRKLRLESGEPWVPVFFEFVVVHPGGEMDCEGTTKRDPQMIVGGKEEEMGHWMIKNV